MTGSAECQMWWGVVQQELLLVAGMCPRLLSPAPPPCSCSCLMVPSPPPSMVTVPLLDMHRAAGLQHAATRLPRRQAPATR